MLGQLQYAEIQKAARSAVRSIARISNTTLKTAVRRAVLRADPLVAAEDLRTLALKVSATHRIGKVTAAALTAVQAAIHGLVAVWLRTSSEANRLAITALFRRLLRPGKRE